MNFRQVASVLRARSGIALLIAGGVIGAGLAYGLNTPLSYTARTQVLVDIGSPDRATGQALNPGAVSSYIATQIDLINSQTVSLKAVDILDAADRKAGRPGFAGGDRERAALVLSKQVDVKPARQSSLLEIAARDTAADRAARIANAVAQAYLDTALQARVEPARQAGKAFETQSQALRARLEEAQSRLATYQRQAGVTSSDERVDIEARRLEELSSQVTAMRAAALESSKRAQIARTSQGGGLSAELPEVLGNPVLQAQKAEYARLERRLQELGTAQGPNHPEYLRVQQELETARARIAQETRALNDSLGMTDEVNRARLTALEGELATQRSKILQLRQVRGELANLQRDVDSAQRAYDRVNERLEVTALESKTSGANIVVVSPATTPTQPSSPGLTLIAIASSFAGTALAILAVMLLELRNRKVRCLDDLIEVVDAPVIGDLSDLRKPLRLAASNR